MSELVITITSTEEHDTLYREIKSICSETYRIEVDSFGADSIIQIVIPLVGIVAGSTVLATLINKIFDKDIVSIEIDGRKYSGSIKNLPKVIESTNLFLQKQDDSTSP